MTQRAATWQRPVSDADAERFHQLGWWRDITGLDELLAAVRRHPDKAAVVSYRKGRALPSTITRPPMCMCVVADSWCKKVASTALRRSMCFWATMQDYRRPGGSAGHAGDSRAIIMRTIGGPHMVRRPAYADPALRLALLIRPLLAIVEVIIALRVLFRALASQDTGVVSFIYTITGPLVAPWRGIVGDAGDSTHVVESAALIAMGVYAIAALLLMRLLSAIATRRGL